MKKVVYNVQKYFSCKRILKATTVVILVISGSVAGCVLVGSSGSGGKTWLQSPSESLHPSVAVQGGGYDEDNLFWWQASHYNRTLYFMPKDGLGNQLFSAFSMAYWAREAKANLKLVRSDEVIEERWGSDVKSWIVRINLDQILSRPRFSWVEDFPGLSLARLHAADYAPNMTMHPYNCTLHSLDFVDLNTSRSQIQKLLDHAWEKVANEEVLCVEVGFLPPPGSMTQLNNFYRSLTLAPMLQKRIESFKYDNKWEDTQWIGVHVRRTDLATIYSNGTKGMLKGVLPITAYTQKIRPLVDNVQWDYGSLLPKPRIFLATDDMSILQEFRLQFGKNQVVTLPDRHEGRSSRESIDTAVLDMTMLSHCAILFGTRGSTFSGTAWRMSGNYFYEINPDEADH